MAQSEMLRHSLRLFSIDVEGLFARLCVMHRLFSPYLLAAGFIFIAAVFGFVRLPHSQPAIAPAPITYSMYFCIWAGILLLALIHESFHGFAGIHYGLKPKRITAALYLGFIPYAFISIPGVYTIAPRRRIVLWSAGIYANMLLAAVFLLVQSLSGNLFAAQVLKSLIWVNFSLVLFNVVPFMGTDSYFILSTVFKVPNIRTNAYTEFKHWIRREEHKFSGFLIVYFTFSFGLLLYFVYRLLLRLYLTAAAVSREGLHLALLYHAWPFAMIFLMFVARRLWDHRDRKRNPEEHGGAFTSPRNA